MFIAIDNQSIGKRITTQASENGTANNIIDHYDDVRLHEVDKVTELSKSMKSGREWYGEEFDKVLSYNFSETFDNIDASKPVYFRSFVAGRSTTSSNFTIKTNSNVITQPIGSTSFDYLSPYALNKVDTSWINVSNGNTVTLEYTYNKPTSSSLGWLNYYEMIANCHLRYNNGYLIFKNPYSVTNATQINKYIIDRQSNSNYQVWDVTDFHNVKEQVTSLEGNKITFQSKGDVLREYMIFDGTNTLSVKGFGKIGNQNLRGMEQPDLLIITHPSLESAAKRVAEFHRIKDGMKVSIVATQTIYNEFSSGAQDISGIRNFIKMLYERPKKLAGTKPLGHVLLFGDASYDYKNRLSLNHNFVPTYESQNSTENIESYCTDDYYALLDSNEGRFDGGLELLDVSIGRMPVNNLEDANAMVDKLYNYTSPEALGEWRNNLTFVADDEDWNTYVDDNERLIEYILRPNYKNFNYQKIYLDAYQQVSGANGQKYPEAYAEINRKMDKGNLIWSYMGHGGEEGLAHERVVDIESIKSWENKYRLPVFSTATCEFSRFDDPGRVSAGEIALLSNKGGAIASYTTTRVVNASGNYRLSEGLFKKNIFELKNGEMQRLGNVYIRGKNESIDTDNNRRFALLGDPALRLAVPLDTIITTHINTAVVDTILDTIRPLQKYIIKGYIKNHLNGQPNTSFNGRIYPTIFDKKQTYYTLANDPGSSRVPFDVQTNIIYKGVATVTNGYFEFSFIAPKDISYSNQKGKISYYAENGVTDASGSYHNLILSGGVYTSTRSLPPVMKLYINDTNFRDGGITNQNPFLLAKLSDDMGINTVGLGIGHEITGWIDGGKPIVMNDFFSNNLDDFRNGWLKYPLEDISEGKHTLKLRVWDVENNFAQGEINFEVINNRKLSIQRLFVYPNPVITDKAIFSFEQNGQDETLQATLNVYNMQGKLIKTIEQKPEARTSRNIEISWDCSQEAQGVYLYRLMLKSSNGLEAEEKNKLVLIRN
jgi:hypothetical protein